MVDPKTNIQPKCLNERLQLDDNWRTETQRVEDAGDFREYLSFRLWSFIGRFHNEGEDVLLRFPDDAKCFDEVNFRLDVSGVG